MYSLQIQRVFWVYTWDAVMHFIRLRFILLMLSPRGAPNFFAFISIKKSKKSVNSAGELDRFNQSQPNYISRYLIFSYVLFFNYLKHMNFL